MKLSLDSQAIELPCPSCRRKFTKTVGELKTKTHLACPLCRADIALDNADFRQELAKVEQSLAQLGKAAGRVGN